MGYKFILKLLERSLENNIFDYACVYGIIFKRERKQASLRKNGLKSLRCVVVELKLFN